MEFLMEHWLSVGVGAYLLAMVLYGHYRGFLKMAVTMTALIFSLIAVQVAMPYVTDALRENTGIHRAIGQGLLHMAGADENATDGVELPAQQREAIERLKLPEQMKEALLENNNTEIYELLGVDRFLDYLGQYLANMVINLAGSALLFVYITFPASSYTEYPLGQFFFALSRTAYAPSWLLLSVQVFLTLYKGAAAGATPPCFFMYEAVHFTKLSHSPSSRIRRGQCLRLAS